MQKKTVLAKLTLWDPFVYTIKTISQTGKVIVINLKQTKNKGKF